MKMRCTSCHTHRKKGSNSLSPTKFGIGACFWPSLGGCVCERFLGTGCEPKGEKQNQTTSTLDKVFLGTKVLTNAKNDSPKEKEQNQFSPSQKFLAQECRKTFPTTGFTQSKSEQGKKQEEGEQKVQRFWRDEGERGESQNHFHVPSLAGQV